MENVLVNLDITHVKPFLKNLYVKIEHKKI